MAIFVSDKKTGATQGFTLTEMAIVIVIIGLLTGGVVVTKSLIRSSQISSAIVDVSYYEGAVANFQRTYGMLPGDFTNAVAVWGAANADPTTCQTTQGTGTQTCNGNGDGQISGTSHYESYRFWQQLANAGLIKGNYTGIPDPALVTDRIAVIGVNIPASAIGGGMQVGWTGTIAGADSTRYAGNYKNTLLVAMPWSDTLLKPAMTPGDAQTMDKKMDDGMPGTGNVRSFKSSSSVVPNCTDSDTQATAAYRISSNLILCSLEVISGF